MAWDVARRRPCLGIGPEVSRRQVSPRDAAGILSVGSPHSGHRARKANGGVDELGGLAGWAMPVPGPTQARDTGAQVH